jgi:tetratricopeptide (TPR) repeat protein
MNKARNYLLTSALIVVSTFGMYTNAYAHSKFAGMFSEPMEPQEVYSQNVDSIHSLQINHHAGSAVAVSEDVLVTNCHVLSHGHEIYIDGQPQPLQIVNRDFKELDLCFIYVANMNFKPVSIRASSDVKVGEKAYAIGNPQGLNKTLSQGIVSNKLDRKGAQWLQTDAAISPGSSGGGLFDDKGNLVGITSAILNNASNIGFVAPSDPIIKVVTKLKMLDRAPLKTKAYQFQQTEEILTAYNDIYKNREFIQEPTQLIQELAACADNNNLYCAIHLTAIYTKTGQYQAALPMLMKLNESDIDFGPLLLMSMHIKGSGVDKDEAKALQYAKKGALLGDEACAFYVASSFYKQALINFKKKQVKEFKENITQAYAWFKVSFFIGNNLAKDQEMLDLCKNIEDLLAQEKLLDDAAKLSDDICNSITHCVRY